MKILIVGQGGREAALTWSCVRDGNAVFVAPGNGGTRAAGATPLPSVASDAAVVAWCAAEKPDLVVVGPEVPLVAGLAGACRARAARALRRGRRGRGRGQRQPGAVRRAAPAPALTAPSPGSPRSLAR